MRTTTRDVFAAAGLSLLALAAGTACAPRYSARGPMTFEQIPYAGPSGKAWPVAFAELPEVAKTYGMAKAPRVAYVELNKGGPKGSIVFMHGLGSYLKFWYFQLDAFAEAGWHVVAIDQPGYGKSEKPASFPYTMEAMGDVVREVLGQLGVQKPVLVGHSMGGQIAMSYGIRYPDEVRALVLVAPAGLEEFSAREKQWFKNVYSTSLVKKQPEYGIWGTVALANFSNFRPELYWLVEERVRVVKDPAFDSYAYAQVRSVNGLANDDFVRMSAGKITAPTLIVFGEEDKLIPSPFMHAGFASEHFARTGKSIPGATLVGLPGCGHCVQLDCPTPWAAAVNGFLEGR
jgi:pimeloyl-ACP methyl ester carboxylesterase